ncbi:dTDP-4-dehydrorhamnose reductase [Cupriavidus metallidurans]|uniref:dTDP-4-dehydrorhamnose reductase n=1 Tax=Cupriavidus metallidurans TaxID=119219 RepID=UPI001645F765|nr:dTDP-4-dehydrorhamnose reductase [Cupriavidus metallidurans]
MRPSLGSVPTLLVLGGTGQVGFELRRSLAPLGRLVVPARHDVDMMQPEDLRRSIRSVRPEIIVCAAAYTGVDAAQAHRAEAYSVNAVAPAVIANEAAALGALLIHYSSDYVFDGTKIAPYVEDDVVHPLSVYGESKAAGESAIMEATARYLILRTSWVFGIHGSNFAKTILQKARDGGSLRIVADQVGAPTPAALIADITAHAIRAYWCGDLSESQFGIYHVASAGETSWHGYARDLLQMAVDRGMPTQIDPSDVVAVSSTDYSTVAMRPANSRLDTSRITQTFGLCMPEWRVGVAHMLDQLSVSW